MLKFEVPGIKKFFLNLRFDLKLFWRHTKKIITAKKEIIDKKH